MCIENELHKSLSLIQVIPLFRSKFESLAFPIFFIH